ncbi:hypothetical protein PFISCL1PPCAC_28626, partial [Pristionchus fissidentatus]
IMPVSGGAVDIAPVADSLPSLYLADDVECSGHAAFMYGEKRARFALYDVSTVIKFSHEMKQAYFVAVTLHSETDRRPMTGLLCALRNKLFFSREQLYSALEQNDVVDERGNVICGRLDQPLHRAGRGRKHIYE